MRKGTKPRCRARFPSRSSTRAPSGRTAIRGPRRRALELVGRRAQLPGFGIDEAPIDEDLDPVVLAVLGAILRELQLRDRGVQVELLVETHRGGKVGVGTGVLRRAGRSGRSGFFSGGDRWRGGNEQGSEKEEAHARKATRGTRASRKTEVAEGQGSM